MLCPHCSYNLGAIELNEDEICFCVECGCNVGALQEARGEANGNAKLTEIKALEIKKSNIKKSALAVQYGVSYWTIVAIKNGWVWAHVG